MRVRRIVWVGILSLAAQLPAIAQTIQGSISGTVVDPQGAVIPQAQVTATNTDQTSSVSTTTDSAGDFVFPQLSPASYTVTVEAAGFKKLERRGVILNANTNISVGRLTLQIGGMAESVEVLARSTLEADTAQRGTSLVGEQLKNIEVNGRSYLGLLRLVPGTYTDREFDLNTNELGNIFSNGSRGNQQNLTLNGVSNTDYGANSRMIVTVSLDSVQEVKVLTSNYDAQYGKNAGAQISVVTKAGTQDFRGSGYTYYRDRDMNANKWINNRDGLPKALYHYNYYGYTIGGPAYIPDRFNSARDKLFFFWSDEYQRQLTPRDQNGNTLFRTTVPTPLERQGDFSESLVNNSGQLFNLIRDPLSGQPCTSANHSGCFQDGGVLGKIPASRLYAPGVALLNLLPLPNTTGANGYNYLYQPSGDVPRHEQVLRIDYNHGPKLRLYGSWIHLAQDVVSINASASGYSLSPNFPITPVDFYHPGYLFNLNATSVLGSRITNEAQFGVSHHPVTILPHNPQALTQAATGINLPTVYAPLAWIPDFTFGGSRIQNSPQLRYSGAGGAYSPFYSNNTIFEGIDNLTFLHEKHLFKTGIYIHVNHKDQTAFAPTEGMYNWGDSSNNPLDTGFGFANAAVGVYTQFTQASQPANGLYRYTNLEFYGQDTWKMTPRLTVIYGARATWFQPWFDKNLQTSTFLPSNWDPNQAPTLYWPGVINGNQPVALVGSPIGPVAIDPATGQPSAKPQILWGNIVPNSGNVTDGILQAGHGINKYMMQTPGILVGPRVGVTYDITGRGNLILRAGAGKYFDRYQGNEIFNTITNPPTIFVPTFFNGFAQNISTSGGLLGPSGLTVLDPSGHVPAYYKYSAGLQVMLPWSMIVDAAYVGSQGRYLLGNLNLNPVPYGADFLSQNQDPTKVAASPNALPGSNAYNATFLRPYPGYGSITLEKFANDSNYNALQLTLDRRFAKGVFLGVAYTYSKCFDEGSNDGASIRIDTLNHAANYGPCDYDIRHNLIFNYVYTLPSVSRLRRFNNPMTRAVFDGWQLSGTTQFRTGTPFSVGFNVPGYGNQNLTGSQDFGARVRVIGDPYAGTSDSPYNRLNPAAFAPPSVPSIGIESTRNYLNNPGVSAWDMSLQKNVGVTDHAHMEFRVDAFNVFNQTQFSGINSAINFSGLTNPTVTNLAINPTTGAINKGGFGAINGVRAPRILQLLVRFVF